MHTIKELYDKAPQLSSWTTRSISQKFWGAAEQSDLKRTERWLNEHHLDYPLLEETQIKDEHERPAKKVVLTQAIETSRKRRNIVLFATLHQTNDSGYILYANDSRNGRRWVPLNTDRLNIEIIGSALETLLTTEDKDTLIIPSGNLVPFCRSLSRAWKSNTLENTNGLRLRVALEIFSHGHSDIASHFDQSKCQPVSDYMNHLDKLEAESIHIIREVIAEANNPVMLYSVGKDSSVMLHLARKAFYPSPPPFPLLHVDTGWKFQAMYDFRDYIAKESGIDLIVHTNPEGKRKNINPFDHGSALHTDIMKTQGLKQALDQYKFDAAFGGARRDEEKSRAKERVFSFRTSTHQWNPKNQRAELWHQYNGRKNPDESIRIFPLSNWTELDIWQYIYREQIPIVPLYFAAERPVVERDGMLLMVDDDRLELYNDEKILIKKVRFRTLGCYPLTGAIESNADDLASIILELLNAKTSERQGRAIDTDSSASMEKKKQEGYF